MQGIAQQAGELFRHLPGHLGRHGQVQILLLAQPAQDIAAEHTNAPFVGRGVAPAAVVGAADEETGRALGHHGLDGFRFGRPALVVPQMAARNHAGGAVLGGEVGQRPECRAAGVSLAGMGQRIQQVVAVQGLGRLVRADRRDRVGGKLIGVAIGAEGQVHHRQEAIVGDEVADPVGLGEQRMQALRLDADEVGFALRLTVEIGRQVGQHGVDDVVIDQVVNDDAAVGLEDRVDRVARGASVNRLNTVPCHIPVSGCRVRSGSHRTG